ncbi:hypothetical protein H4S06_002062 [Coemansia sp. BCRC 34490]|nr:hypothetical protein H4S06_002062 [Coemansia sp. BCRC 34490]
MSRWISAHPSDYASAHYLHLAAELICGTTNECQKDVECVADRNSLLGVARTELSNTEAGISTLYAEYESVWYHRRWCISVIARSDKTWPYTKEAEFVEKIKSRWSDSEVVVDMATKHMAWIQRFC